MEKYPKALQVSVLLAMIPGKESKKIFIRIVYQLKRKVGDTFEPRDDQIFMYVTGN